MEARLIIDPPASGAWNMAADEALLESAGRQAAATVRFYQWFPETLSLGYFQPYAARQGHQASRALPAVRRATGGGAIVHDRELTYSLCLPSPRFSRIARADLLATHHALLAALSDWGLTASLCGHAAPVSSSTPPFLCFQRRYAEDVLVDRHKVAGSAQRRRRAGTLVHGSLLLSRAESAPELPGLLELTGRSIDTPELAQAWAEQLSSRFGWTLQRAKLSGSEQLRSQQLVEERFSRESWTQKR